jgi:hypothetical protein
MLPPAVGMTSVTEELLGLSGGGGVSLSSPLLEQLAKIIGIAIMANS